MNLDIDTHLTLAEAICLPLFTPFSIRHLRKEGWLNKLIGIIELFPIISLLATGIELLLYNSISLPKKSHFTTQCIAIPGSSQRVVIVANKALFMEHLTGEFHPESPQRVEAIEEALRHAGLMDEENTIVPREATVGEISLCHDKPYQEELQKQIENLPRQYKEHSIFDSSHWKVKDVAGDFIISPKTYQVSLYAAGAPLTAIETILNADNQVSTAFCIVRPPGHHAHQHTGSGFCVFNNIAIAAKHLTQHLGFKRVLIVDWDAHHGDGTQDLVEVDPKIFYFSTHQDTSDGFYPGPHWGRPEQQGVGAGKGTVMNCPVSGTPEECRHAILEAFRNKLVPAMDSYQPQFVLISCGFDAHEKDPLVGLGLKDEDYAELTRICMGIANKYAKGRIVSVLEGGYDLDAIAGAARVHVGALQQPTKGQ
jgi:acetoin utilization deacetylase AcuC-like enzyme